MVVLPLTFIAQEVCVQALLGHSNEATATISVYVQRLFDTDKYTAVSEQILKRIVKLYPKKLTNELLVKEVSLLRPNKKKGVVPVTDSLKGHSVTASATYAMTLVTAWMQ
jgi:hypothetical protein